MKTKFVAALMAFMLCFSVAGIGTAYANQQGEATVTLDLKQVDSQLAARILEAKKELDDKTAKAQQAAQTAKEAAGSAKEIVEVVKTTDPKQVKEWVREVGNVVGEVCKALNVSVNEFIKSPAGIMVAGVVMWKVGGPYVVNTLIDIFFGTTAWFVLTFIWSWIFYKMIFGVRKIKVTGSGKDKIVEYAPSFTFGNSKEADSSNRAVVVLILGAIYLIICFFCAWTVVW